MISERLRNLEPYEEWSDSLEKMREAADVIDALVAALEMAKDKIDFLSYEYNVCVREPMKKIDKALALARKEG